MSTTAGSQPNCPYATPAQRENLRINVEQVQTAVASPVPHSEWPNLPQADTEEV